MILENAFGYLPEILSGSNYAAQKYEGGIVTAVALAVLQELNARNAPNPLSNICVEKLYDTKGFNQGDDISKKRYLRADMQVDLSRMWVGSAGLAKFGWRHTNWLEAKFFRKTKMASTTACTYIAADLIRLCSLVPPESKTDQTHMGRKDKKRTERGKKDQNRTGPVIEPDTLSFQGLCTGRFFLHVYDSKPEDVVGKSRKWVKQLRTPGNQKVSFKVDEDKAKTDFVSRLGNEFKSIKVDLTVTNFCREQNPKGSGYLCVLSRIDSFSISMADGGDDVSYKEDEHREGEQSKKRALVTIRNKVGSFILLGDRQSRLKDNEPPSNDEREENSTECIDDVESEQ